MQSPDVVTQLPTGGKASYLFCDELRGREMTTEGGTRVGTIDDILLDPDACVLGFSLAKVFVRGPVADKKHIVRSAVTALGLKVTSLGATDQPMIVDLSKAETLSLT